MSKALAIVEKISDAHREASAAELWMIVGGIRLANSIANSLSSQAMGAVEQIKEKKLYLAANCQTFEDFLDHHPSAPMKYDAYRRRAKLLESEGTVVFDLLNSLSVSLKTRDLIAGEVEVVGNEIRIGDTRTPLSDNTRIAELISGLHKKTQEQQRTNDRLKKKLQTGQKDYDALKRRQAINASETDSGQSLLTLAGALTRHAEALASASDAERAALKEPTFDVLRQHQLRLSEIYQAPIKAPKKKGKDIGVSDAEVDSLTAE